MPAIRDGRLLVLAAVALAFARLAGGTLPWFLFYAAAGSVTAALMWTLWLGRHLRHEVTADRDRLSAGEVVHVRMRIENTGAVPVPWVEVDLPIPTKVAFVDAPAQGGALGPYGTHLFEFRLTARRRGRLPLGPFRILAGDGLGLFVVRRELATSRYLTVYPRVARIEDLSLPLAQPLGRLQDPRHGVADPARLAEIRPYRPGDSPRHIHWRSSARRPGSLYLKEFERTATTQLLVVLDLDRRAHVAGPAGETVELAVELAAALADLAVRQGFAAGLLAGGAQRLLLPPARGARALRGILEMLAGVEPDGDKPLAEVLRAETPSLPARSTLAVITPDLTPSLAATLLRLRGSHRLLLAVVRSESVAPGTGRARPERDRLARALAARRIPVYLLGAGDDLRRLPAYQVQGPSPAERVVP